MLNDYDYGVDLGPESEDGEEDVITQDEEAGMHTDLQGSMKYPEKVSGLRTVFL